MVTKTQKKGAVHLRFDDGQVFVTPQDYDHFLIEARPAIEGLKRACEVDVWVKNFFGDFVPTLHLWCRERINQVSECYVDIVTGPSLKVFVVGTGAYNQVLGEQIAKLELELEEKGWHSDIVQLPAGSEDELQTFFDTEESIQVYAKSEAASGEGGS